MRSLCVILDWGLCPQRPGIYRVFSARMDVLRSFSGDRLNLSPAVPAAEPVARVASQHCPIPSGSGTPSINQTAPWLNEKPANGQYPLNFVSHPRGSPHIASPFPWTPSPLGRDGSVIVGKSQAFWYIQRGQAT